MTPATPPGGRRFGADAQRRPRAVRAALLSAVGATLALVGAPHDQAASASSPHRAAVVVDLGDGRVKIGCVSFTEDHLSGLEALDRASMAPVAQTYGGQGSAVCALCGKGCTAGSSCLTCKAPNYWAYFHDGVYSPVSASRSEVHDGDTESWRWGKGERPANVAFDTVCPGPEPPTSTPTTKAPAVVPSTPGPAATAPTTGNGGDPAGTGNGGSGSYATPGAGALGSTTVPTAPALPGATSPGAVVPTVPGTKATAVTTSPSSVAPGVSGPTAPGRPSTTTSTPVAGGRTGRSENAASTGPRHGVIERTEAGRRTSAVRSANRVHNQWLSVVAFLTILAIVVGLTVVLRRRRAGIT